MFKLVKEVMLFWFQIVIYCLNIISESDSSFRGLHVIIHQFGSYFKIDHVSKSLSFEVFDNISKLH